MLILLISIRSSKEAEQSLQFYRGGREADHADCELLKNEFNKLQSAHSEKNAAEKTGEKSNDSLTLDDFKSIEARKSMLISIVLVVLNQLCGCFAMLNYTSKFFADAGSALSPNVAAIIVGVIQLISSYITLILVDRLGRKVC